MSQPIVVRVARVESCDSPVPLPSYQTPGSAGLDLRAAVGESVEIPPGERVLIPTGLRFEIPQGWEGQVRPRSGLAIRHGVTVLNSPGTIDSDYRGEVKIILVNLGQEPFFIGNGDRIAQLIFASCEQVELVEVEELTSSKRGLGGFGHTGK